MAGVNKATTDHEAIRQWTEERGGWPATVHGTEGKGEQAGLLRIDFPGYGGGEKLQRISWEEFFNKFEESNLALVYQEETAEGRQSRFNKLVSRRSIET